MAYGIWHIWYAPPLIFPSAPTTGTNAAGNKTVGKKGTPLSECPMAKSCFQAARALLTQAGALPACSDAAWVMILAYDPWSLCTKAVRVLPCLTCGAPFWVLSVKRPDGGRRGNCTVQHVWVLDPAETGVIHT